MNLVTADLNLLVSLGALLDEKNVTRAAGRLNVSQPTMSAALRKLRAHFGDELLVRVGGHYELTPLAQSLSIEIPQVLRAIERTYLDRPGFDPATSTRQFRMLGSDFALSVVAPRLLPVLAQVAPRVELSFESIQPSGREELVERLLAIDFLLMPDAYDPGLPRVAIFADRWVCVSGQERHGVLAASDLAEARWVRVFGQSGGLGLGFFRQIDEIVPASANRVTVDNFGAVPYSVAGTDRLGFMQGRMFDQVKAILPIHEVDIELTIPPINEMAWWHPSRTSDAGHGWLRGLLETCFDENEPCPG